MSKDKVDATVEDTSDAGLKSRRQSLKDIGKFAAVTAPAMLVLLQGGSAAACADTGAKNGWGKNGKASAV